MSKLRFFKYQGTGNDFVMIDNRENVFDRNNLDLVRKLCNRRFGIGADGLILIENHQDYDFEMVYFNADSSQSMCGNGARCAVSFASFLGIISGSAQFLAIDGPHEASLKDNLVYLKMSDVNAIDFVGEDLFVNTGSPHYIRFVNNVKSYDVFGEGRKIRNGEMYRDKGTNVNFVELLDKNKIYVRTYERGVEDETLSCGTGVTAASLACTLKYLTSPVEVVTLGGNLKVSFKKEENNYFKEVYLIGPAEKVFEGAVEIEGHSM